MSSIRKLVNTLYGVKAVSSTICPGRYKQKENHLLKRRLSNACNKYMLKNKGFYYLPHKKPTAL